MGVVEPVGIAYPRRIAEGQREVARRAESAVGLVFRQQGTRLVFRGIVKHLGDGDDLSIDDVFVPPNRHGISVAAPAAALSEADRCPRWVDVGRGLLCGDRWR